MVANAHEIWIRSTGVYPKQDIQQSFQRMAQKQHHVIEWDGVNIKYIVTFHDTVS